MKFRKFGLQGRRRSVVSVIALAVVAALALTGAVLYPGFRTAEVDLNDGGVWVTNKSIGKVGHLNYQSQTLDAGLTTPTNQFDVQQDAATVFMTNGEDASVSPVDVSNVVLGQPTGLPGHSRMVLGTEAVAVVDAVQGRVWAMGVEGLPAFSGTDTEPLMVDVEGAVAAMGVDDRLHVAVPAQEKLLTFERQEDGAYAEAGSRGLAGLKDAEDPQIAAVGKDAVVFDAGNGTVHLPGGGTTGLDPADTEGARLQQSGPVSDIVAIATAKSLVKLPLRGGEGTGVDAGAPGVPAAPVQLDGCIHAAWDGSRQYLRDCEDDGNDRSQSIPELEGQSELVFRVNRDVVVLNDMSGGTVWLVNHDMHIVDNWADLEPPPGEDDQKAEEDSNEINPVTDLPDRTEENTPPVAVDDEFGVRAGRTTILPVLFNDSDSDGDLLTAALEGDQPSAGTVQAIYDGTGLQVVVPSNASGAGTFSYKVDDGRGGTDTATVRLTVVPADSNRAPVQLRESVLSLEQGQSLTQNVLTDWIDPDGDDLQLTAARVAEGSDIVRIRPDGELTFQDVGVSTGRKEVSVTVSDGQDSTTATMVFDVKPRGVLAPVGNADYASGAVGEEIVISPLKNDVDPTGGELRLAKVDEIADATVKANIDAGTVSFRSERPGTYYLTYLVTNGPASATALIRIDVLPPDASAGAPVAVRDTALLPSAGEVLVDVLANDSDPAGGVLVVQSVSAPKDSAITLSVIDHHIIRVSDTRGLTAPTSFSYVVSNGRESATGEVSVSPVPAPAKLQPPRAIADEATVRVGDVVNIPVLANDEHPNGAALTLLPELVESVDPAQGLLTVSETGLRFKAGSQPGTVNAVYAVAGPDGQEASAQVTIHIRPVDGQNSPPLPKHVTGRVLAGETASLLIPLDGIDPDGDSVTLVGLDQTPGKGTATVRAAAIDYAAPAGASGTDTFSYVVEDRLGARATGTVSVGIAPVSTTNQPPIAVDDEITVRPGRSIASDVLANDTDADGDTIRYTADGLQTDAAVDVAVVDGRVTLTAPEEPGVFIIRYGIEDGRGGTDTGNLKVDVQPDARLLAPIARDDRVAVSETEGKTEVQVPILRNDEDPDGVASDLEVSLPEGNANVSVGADGALTVGMTAQSQLIPYTLRDIDGLTATAFVMVPGSAEARPTLASTEPLEVVSGETLELDLNSLVKVREGRSPRLTVEDKVQAVSGTAAVNSATGITFTSNPDYAGPASVSFEVTDGSGPDDPQGFKAVLTVGINVTPKQEENRPPSFRANTLEVAQGEPAASLDLRQAVSDPDPGDTDRLSFQLTGGSLDGVDVSLDGSVLTARADADAPKGATGVFDVAVSDGSNPPVTSTVTVNVVSTNRPLAVANDDVIADAHQGRAESVNVLTNDTNPFPESPLRLVTANVNAGQGTASVSGGVVQVTPAADFVGTMEVRYRVQDQTRDPEREVEGRVLLTVKGKPDAPATPVVQEVRDQTVVLIWDPPANNGEAITGYTVTGSSGFSQACAATTCTLTGLTNNVEYVFQVTAANAVGESDPSPQSAPARPDVKPEMPAPPALDFGDGSLNIAWTPPVSKGSPVSSYNLEISPPPTSGVAEKRNITAPQYTWTGLTNGVAYKVRVQAVNDAVDPSDWSAYSAAEIPAGVPDAPAAPTASRDESTVNGGVVNVAWKAPPSNGDSVSRYDLMVYRNGALESTQTDLPGAVTSHQLTGLQTTADYTFAVVAHNKAGASAAGGQSASVRPYGQPQAVQSVSAVATGENTRIKLNFAAPGSNGSPISGYQVSVDGGGWSGIGGPGATVNVGNNGNPGHTFRVRAVNAAGAGPASPASNAETAYGPINNASNIRKSSSGIHASFSWNANPDAYGNGRPVTGMDVTVNGNRVANNGQWNGGDSPDQTHTLRITVTRADGSQSFSDSVTTASRQAVMGQGQHKTDGDCFSKDCYYFAVTLKNFAANRNVEVFCHYTNMDGSTYVFSGFTIRTNDDGYAYSDNLCYLGHKNSINKNNDWTGPYWFHAVEGGSGVRVDSNKNVSW